jgi:hypothetical protein
LDVEVVCERGEEENLKKDAESRNVKLPPISRPLCGASTVAFGRICVFVIFVMVRFSVVNRQTFLPRPKTKKVKLRKREKNRRRNKGLLLLSHGTTRGDETPEHPRA